MKWKMILILLVLACLQQESNAMIYRSNNGGLWDPSVIYHNGKYHAFSMFNKHDDKNPRHVYCLYSISDDGVHWKDKKVVLKEQGDENIFFKCFVGKFGDSFIMDHGVVRRTNNGRFQDTLRFYESTDLLNWKHLFNSTPDPRWYTNKRWDHMYAIPKEEGNHDAGYWGYVVSVNKSGPSAVGMMQSKDGKEWETLPPAKIEWGDIPPNDDKRGKALELGGCERIGGKYYLIAGRPYFFSRGYSIWTFVADNPRGPFRPDVEAFRLCGTSTGEMQNSITWLTVWVRGKDGELLIQNYASMPSYGHWSPWFLPFRKAVIDKDGHLRLGWWQGNEALKGESLALNKNEVTLKGKCADDGYNVAYLDLEFDYKQGVVIEGTIKAKALVEGCEPTTVPSAGLALGDIAKDATAVQLGIGKSRGRETHIGSLLKKEGKLEFESKDVTGKMCATVTGIDDGKEHTFRLLCRLEMFELYIDDLLMQTYLYKPDSGKIGFVACNAEAIFSDLKAWKMSLPSESDDNLQPVK